MCRTDILVLLLMDHHEISDDVKGDALVHIQARRCQEAEYKQQIHSVAKLQRLIKMQEERLSQVSERHSNLPADESQLKLVDQRIKNNEINPSQIAPEDALDTIVRLENQLKMQQRRNLFQRKELDKLRRDTAEKRETLAALQKHQDLVLDVTGWDGRVRTFEEQDSKRAKIEEMDMLAKRLREEHSAARVIISKKEHVAQFLTEELKKRIEMREQLELKYNDIRVADRDNRETLEAINALRKQDAGQDGMIISSRESKDTVAIDCLRQDTQFLQAEVRAKKAKRLEQDRVMKAQIARAKKLTTRFEVIAGCLRDLGLDVAAQDALTAVPPAVDAHTEPTDKERIAPSNEVIPTPLYELILRDMVNIRSAVSRKDVMVVEKQCVLDALESKYQRYSEVLRHAQQQESMTKEDKLLEMQHLHATLAEQHLKYRQIIDEMLSKNLKLKNEVIRRANPPAQHPPSTKK